MKAIQINRYSQQITTQLVDLPIPTITDNEVLVRVKAAGVNPLDNMIIKGDVKLIVPYAFPVTLGNELAGVVESVGKDVTQFQVGDRVFGRLPLSKIGAFAEYCAVEASALAKIPDYLTDIQAAAIPLTALTAFQALELMRAKSGESLFISGASGGFGAMAIPIAKSRGLKVYANGSAGNKERLLSLGVDRFFDYKTEDYSQTLSQVDLVIDSIGEKELPRQFSILKNGGRLVSLRGMPNGDFAKRQGLGFFKQILFGLAGAKYDRMAKKNNNEYHFIFVQPNGKQLQEIADLFIAQALIPAIDSIYPLERATEALQKIANGNSIGKTILEISQ